MLASIFREYGSPAGLTLEEIEQPQPNDNQLLIEVKATALNYADWHLLTGEPYLARLSFGFPRPKINTLGADVAGRVVTVGKNVSLFKPGDEVLGDISACGWGGLAQYALATEDLLVKKPANLSFEQAAALPMAGTTALQGLRLGNIQAGMKVLINGASGGVGSFALQLAKDFDIEVSAVCSPRNTELVRELGADYVIDYTCEDFTRSNKHYDLILAVNGYQSLADYRRVLSPAGRYVCCGGSMPQIFQSLLLGPLVSMFGDKKFLTLTAHPNRTDLSYLTERAENGRIRPVIDRVYPLEQAADALSYLGEGHARGKIVVQVSPE
ncbi:MAG: NAD(P)-dependent alcohol dehydrogenase [Anaerolineae bacterium]|nr:NAD(P)-dependent alcohol dehydrogenase [Anaerolineae bacterium]